MLGSCAGSRQSNEIIDAFAYLLYQGWFGISNLPTHFQLTRLLPLSVSVSTAPSWNAIQAVAVILLSPFLFSPFPAGSRYVWRGEPYPYGSSGPRWTLPYQFYWRVQLPRVWMCGFFSARVLAKEYEEARQHSTPGNHASAPERNQLSAFERCALK
jgi:hypothetical protein